jgi:2-(1,2-epoxy-1,2-dihydrophenyl)acetyl-CoA isomerase
MTDRQPIETGTQYVEAWIERSVGVLRLNRPERRNALHPDMYPALRKTLASFGDDDRVGCVILTGAGSAFCAGGDVRGDGRGSDYGRPAGGVAADGLNERARQLTQDGMVAVDLHELPKLTMAAINGSAVGAGMALALACDLRIAAPSARLVTGWITLGFSGDFGGTWLLTRLLGPAKALQLLVEGKPLSAGDAQALGLVNRVVDDRVVDDRGLWPEALDWAADLASGPRSAHHLIKQNIRDALQLSLREALPVEAERMQRSAATDDHRRALKAWMAARGR